MRRIGKVALTIGLIVFVALLASLALPLLLVFVVVYFLAVVFGTLSQMTYEKKSIPEIKARFPQTLLKYLVLVIVLMVSSYFWHYMGWRDGQPIHLPWHST